MFAGVSRCGRMHIQIRECARWGEMAETSVDLDDDSIYARVNICSYERGCLWEQADHVAADSIHAKGHCAYLVEGWCHGHARVVEVSRSGLEMVLALSVP